jgi:amino acid transporter
VGNIAVAISWSDYFTSLLSGLGIHVPEYLCVDYLSALRGHEQVVTQLGNGIKWADIASPLQEAYNAWTHAPQIGSLHLIGDLPAFGITCLITWLVYVGIYESKVAGNIMVILKMMILMLVIGVGSFYVSPHNWSPFAPNGVGGVLKGVSGVFFAYIGFDAISTTAEECKNPQQDLPKAMIYSLLITTILYVVISLVLTGMVSYKELGTGDPLAYVFQKLHLNWISGIVAFSAIIAMASVLLVFQVGQPRIWMSMSRDGLLPRIFSDLHPKFKTPWFSTIVTGIVVAVPSLFMNLTEVTDLTSIGTLFAFMLVSGGVLILDYKKKSEHPNKKQFYIPYFNSRFYLIPIWLLVFILLFFCNKDIHKTFFHTSLFSIDKIPILIFSFIALLTTIFAIVHQFSIIPVLGLLSNMYLMTELGITNWLRFLIWLLVGLVLYFTFGMKHSKLNR